MRHNLVSRANAAIISFNRHSAVHTDTNYLLIEQNLALTRLAKRLAIVVTLNLIHIGIFGAKFKRKKKL